MNALQRKMKGFISKYENKISSQAKLIEQLMEANEKLKLENA